MRTTHRPGHGDGHNGKESNKGNGASENKMGQDPPTLPPHSPEDWGGQTDLSTPSGQALEDRDKQKSSSPAPAGQAHKRWEPNIVEPPEHGNRSISTASTPANEGPKQSEHYVAAGPHHQGLVAVPQQEAGKVTDTVRTPPSAQIARRGREDDYSPIASPNNVLGDHSHDEDHKYDGKDERRLPAGKSRR